MFIRILAPAVGLTAVLFSYRAPALDTPKGDVILTVTSKKLDHPNVSGTAQFDMLMLEALAGRKGQMETPWTEGAVTFSGPLHRSVIEAAGAHGSNIKVIALNDYAADLPIEECNVHRYDVSHPHRRKTDVCSR